MDSRQCAVCGQRVLRRSQVCQQDYCSAIKCQRERRRLWQRAKRKKDPDYKSNQARAQQAWGKRNPEYWREYRRTHPVYCERNRALQQGRNGKRKTNLIAKMNQSAAKSPVLSGIYRLVPVAVTGIAKMDAWTVEIKFLSGACDSPGDDAGGMQ